MFLGLAASVFAVVMAPPIWARRKLKVLVGRLGQAGSVLVPVVIGGQTGMWPTYGQGYA
jgi:hypothetical protein